MREFASLLGSLSLIHGLTLGIVLIYLSSKKKPSFLLGVFLALYGLSFLPNLIRDYTVTNGLPDLYFLPFRFTFLAFPILYLYVKGLMVKSSFRENKKHLYAGAAEFIICSCLFLFVSHESQKEIYYSNYFDAYILAANIFSIFYLLKIRTLIKENIVRVHDFHSTVDHKLLSWLKPIVYIFLWMTTFDFIHISIQQGLKLDLEFLYQPLFILYILQISINMLAMYWVVIFGMKQYYISIGSTEMNTPSKLIETDKTQENFDDFEEIFNQINTLINETKCFTNHEFTISDLANSVGVHHRKLSKVINHKADCNFNHFINEFRVEEAKRIMRNPVRTTNLTLEGIGKEAGFNSSSSFYRAFKTFEGQTPAKFVK